MARNWEHCCLGPSSLNAVGGEVRGKEGEGVGRPRKRGFGKGAVESWRTEQRDGIADSMQDWVQVGDHDFSVTPIWTIVWDRDWDKEGAVFYSSRVGLWWKDSKTCSRTLLAREQQIGHISTFQGRGKCQFSQGDESSVSEEAEEWSEHLYFGSSASTHSCSLVRTQDRFGGRALPCATETREGASISSCYTLVASAWACDLSMANYMILPGTLKVKGVIKGVQGQLEIFQGSYHRVKDPMGQK